MWASLVLKNKNKIRIPVCIFDKYYKYIRAFTGIFTVKASLRHGSFATVRKTVRDVLKNAVNQYRALNLKVYL
jgi:hypothetical protein